jgi:hypothetical protein
LTILLKGIANNFVTSSTSITEIGRVMTVHIGSVHKIDARVERRMNDLYRFRLVSAPAEIHATQTESTYFETSATKIAKLHIGYLLDLSHPMRMRRANAQH